MLHSVGRDRDLYFAAVRRGVIKAKFGDSLLARSDAGQMKEALCKVLAHNIVCVIHAMHELGIEPTFGLTA